MGIMTMEKRAVFAAVFAFVIAYYYKYTQSHWIEGPLVNTEYGMLKGIKSLSRGGREYFEFLGIPYAKPPVGSLRFEVIDYYKEITPLM
jgi:hypothetical protein